MDSDVGNNLLLFYIYLCIYVNMQLMCDGKVYTIHAALRAMQKVIFDLDGLIRQFLVDDKVRK